MENILNYNNGVGIWEGNVSVSATTLTPWHLCDLSLWICCLVDSVFNGQSAIQACNRLAELQEFRSSQTVKVNPDRPQQQARFLTLEVSGVWMKKLPSLFPSSPLNQGAFKACARVSELQVFTHTAEVKVDPDKPLEGVRLAVLQVALSERLFHTGIHTCQTQSQKTLQRSYSESPNLPVFGFCEFLTKSRLKKKTHKVEVDSERRYIFNYLMISAFFKGWSEDFEAVKCYFF